MFYVVFDDVLQGNDRGWTADNFADALRSPLAGIGVRVLRQNGLGNTSNRAGFQALGYSAFTYEAKLDEVEDIVNSTLKCGVSTETSLRDGRRKQTG
jgi:hypothetical protein